MVYPMIPSYVPEHKRQDPRYALPRRSPLEMPLLQRQGELRRSYVTEEDRHPQPDNPDRTLRSEIMPRSFYQDGVRVTPRGRSRDNNQPLVANYLNPGTLADTEGRKLEYLLEWTDIGASDLTTMRELDIDPKTYPPRSEKLKAHIRWRMEQTADLRMKEAMQNAFMDQVNRELSPPGGLLKNEEPIYDPSEAQLRSVRHRQKRDRWEAFKGSLSKDGDYY